MEPRRRDRPKRTRFEKPEGGYRLIRVPELVLAWWSYVEGHIQFRDLRAYFACHEVSERRRGVPSGRTPTYRLSELQRLLGGNGGEALRASLRRLERLGLTRWGRGGVAFATSPDELKVEDLSGYWRMLDCIRNNRRAVPVPRRTLRFLAGGAKRAVVAAALGHLFRCVYGNREGVSFDGWCKASWVATTFRVSERRVKEARAHLEAIGWLQVASGTPQWSLNRLGAKVSVSHTWEQDGSKFSTAESAPLDLETEVGLAPPDSDQNPPSERYNNQNLAPGRGEHRVGACAEESKKPDLRHVLPVDLKQTGRLLQLFDQAVTRGHLDGGDATRLDFVAAAEHALVVGSSNPSGLFAWLVRHRRFGYVTQADEEAAQKRLKEHLYGSPEPRAGALFVRPAERTQLSEDACLVRALRVTFQTRRIRQDPFLYVRRERPEWTRDRWDRAVLELENAELFARRARCLAAEGEHAEAC